MKVDREEFFGVFSDNGMGRLTTAEFGWNGRLILRFLAVRTGEF
jgi:hypothetical protein